MVTSEHYDGLYYQLSPNSDILEALEIILMKERDKPIKVLLLSMASQ